MVRILTEYCTRDLGDDTGHSPIDSKHDQSIARCATNVALRASPAIERPQSSEQSVNNFRTSDDVQTNCSGSSVRQSPQSKMGQVSIIGQRRNTKFDHAFVVSRLMKHVAASLVLSASRLLDSNLATNRHQSGARPNFSGAQLCSFTRT